MNCKIIESGCWYSTPSSILNFFSLAKDKEIIEKSNVKYWKKSKILIDDENYLLVGNTESCKRLLSFTYKIIKELGNTYLLKCLEKDFYIFVMSSSVKIIKTPQLELFDD